MKTVPYIWMNGKTLSWKDAKTHLLTHTLHYGGGAFEGIRFYKTKNGPAIFRLKEHLKRLQYSASKIDLKIFFTEDEIVEAIKKLIVKNKMMEGYIRPIAYYGYGKMGLLPFGAENNLAIAMWPMGAYLGTEPVKAFISKVMRLHPKSIDPKAKFCGNYINSILASLEAHQKNCDEAILLDYRGNVAEGPGENIFIVKNKTLITPKEGSILPGITRKTLLTVAKDLGIKTKEIIVTKKMLLNADEAFFCGTAAEVSPIAQIDGKKIKNGTIGPISKLLKETYTQIVSGKNEKYRRWLTYAYESHDQNI